MNLRGIILLIEDNINIQNANRRALEKVGFRVAMAESLRSARTLLVKIRPDAIVLDIMLPDGNGLDFIAEIRRYTTAPVLVLTALGEKEDVLKGLRTGGDDYITKPYDLDELRERVAAFIRRKDMLEQHMPELLAYGQLTLDPISQHAYFGGVDLLLAPKEFALLLALFPHRGTYIDAPTLYQMIWKAPMVGDGNALWKLISRLKKKLEAQTDSVRLTVSRGEGYKLEFD